MDFTKVKLVVSDMDGSLLDSQHRVHPSFYDIFSKMTESGIAFCAASGRQYASIVDKLNDISADIWIAAENGALLRKGPTTYLEQGMPREAVKAVLDEVNKHNEIHAIVCTTERAYFSSSSKAFVSVMSEFYASHAVVDDPLAHEDTVIKVALYHSKSSEQYIYPQLSRFQPQLQVKISGQFWVDISMPLAHKGTAIQMIQEKLGVTSEETMVFGDYHNDLEMLACSAFSYAMGNAHEDVKKAANFITVSNDEQGVIKVLKQLVSSY